MKRLLSLVGILALAAAMLPSDGFAGLRGAFEPITLGTAADGIGYTNQLSNGIQTPALRSVPFGAVGGVGPRVERWFAFTHRSLVVGFETTREIWQARNLQQSGFQVAVITDARSPLLKDPSGQISYTDPAWSNDGKYLAYVQTDPQVTQSAIYVQEYTVSTTMSVAITPIGAPILVVPMSPGVRNRHPDWSPDGTTLVYDSDASGTSIDVYTVQVFPAVGAPVRRTFVSNRAEQNPAWAPDGVRVAYDTNRFGPNVIEILDTSTGTVTLAETNFAQVAHNNPDWSSDGASIYYDAPGNEDSQSNPDIWKLDLATQAKCPILFDGNGDVNVSVSRHVNFTVDGIPFNTFLFESQAAGFGLIIWRSNHIQTCVPPLPMAVTISPQTINLDANGQDVQATLSFPPETEAVGYQAVSFNGPREGIRMRTTIVRSPTMMGLTPRVSAQLGSPFPQFVDHSNNSTSVDWSRRNVASRLVALGLVNRNVPVEVNAYSNTTGRGFRGFGFINVATSNLAGSAVKLEQNAPNPFNPVTKINFAVSKPGKVALRVYNIRGELVKTIANQHFEAGNHTVTWDGRNSFGSHVASGVYYTKVATSDGASDLIKMVMAK